MRRTIRVTKASVKTKASTQKLLKYRANLLYGMIPRSCRLFG
jgi:hypothetical protein